MKVHFSAVAACTLLGCGVTPSPSRAPDRSTSLTEPGQMQSATQPVASASASASAPEEAGAVVPSSPSALPSASPEAAAAPPHAEAPRSSSSVKVIGIGMHIGGGPNDNGTKAPFETAIGAKVGDMERCAEEVQGLTRGTFGIDLLIATDGGHPQTSNVRTILGGDHFKKCMVAAFESVEFARPKHGKTKLSYAIRIEPGK